MTYLFNVRSTRKNGKIFVAEISANSYDNALSKVLALYPGRKISLISEPGEMIAKIDSQVSPGRRVTLTRGHFKGLIGIIQEREGVKHWVEVMGERARVLTGNFSLIAFHPLM